MKLIILFLLPALTMALLMSCSKEKLFKKDVYGKWERRSAVGFEFPYREYAPGNGTYLELTTNGTLNSYENWKITHTTSYSIQNKKAECEWSSRKSYWALVYDDSEDEIEVRNDTLFLSTPPCWADGGTSTYVRIHD